MEQPRYTSREIQRVKRRQTVRVFVLTILVAAVALFVADNTHDVTIGWLFGDSEIPVIVGLLGTWAAGAVSGLLIVWHVRARPEKPDQVVDLTENKDVGDVEQNKDVGDVEHRHGVDGIATEHERS